VNVLIAGDLFVSDACRGKNLFEPSIQALFAAADFRIVNLEAPLAAPDKNRRIYKTGPNLRGSPEVQIPLLEALRVDLVTLANNHVMDYGAAGLSETLVHLRSAGIRPVGAGLTLEEAARPFVLEREGLRVGILNFGENEWASAGPGRGGSNPYDPLAILDGIREVRKSCDQVILIIHGGQEDYNYPTPRMVREYRFYAENGASAVVGHHPHAISGSEVHRGVPIFYSLGNFLFTHPSPLASWFKGLVLSLRIEPGRAISGGVVPVAAGREDFRLTRLAGEPRETVDREVEAFSRVIANPAALLGEWEGFLAANGRRYLKVFNPVNAFPGSWLRRGLFRLHLDRLLTRRGHYAEILDTIRCESHAEAARSSIERLLK
jgi:hypothetical protein